MDLWAAIFWAVSTVGFTALAGGFLGAVHPAGDALAVARGPVSLAGTLWIGLGWATGVAAPAWLIPVALAGAPVVAAYARREGVPSPSGTVAIYQKNMSFRMACTAALEADIRDVAPDLLTLQELTAKTAPMLENLSDILPTSVVGAPTEIGAVALATRWPAVAGSEIRSEGLAAVQVETPRGRVWVVSLHLGWPWPWAQADHLRRRLALLEPLGGPILLGGDFNMVPWSHALRRIASVIGAERAGRARRSFPLNRWLALPIDHVLIPAGRRGASRLRPRLGSDHHGLEVRF